MNVEQRKKYELITLNDAIAKVNDLFASTVNDAIAKVNDLFASIGLERVRTTPQPRGQKFDVGSFVDIAQDLGGWMEHFPKGRPARVEYTYAHAYWGDDVKSYSLKVRTDEGKWASVAWYYENQLSLVTDGDRIARYLDEIGKQA